MTNISDVASAERGAVEEIKQKQRISGFNSIFAVASVPMAKLYYDEFRRQMDADPTKKLKVAVIFSYAPNEEEADGIYETAIMSLFKEETSSVELIKMKEITQELEKAVNKINSTGKVIKSILVKYA